MNSSGIAWVFPSCGLDRRLSGQSYLDWGLPSWLLAATAAAAASCGRYYPLIMMMMMMRKLTKPRGWGEAEEGRSGSVSRSGFAYATRVPPFCGLFAVLRFLWLQSFPLLVGVASAPLPCRELWGVDRLPKWWAATIVIPASFSTEVRPECAQREK